MRKNGPRWKTQILFGQCGLFKLSVYNLNLKNIPLTFLQSAPVILQCNKIHFVHESRHFARYTVWRKTFSFLYLPRRARDGSRWDLLLQPTCRADESGKVWDPKSQDACLWETVNHRLVNGVADYVCCFVPADRSESDKSLMKSDGVTKLFIVKCPLGG